MLEIFSCSCMNCIRSLECIKKLDRAYSRHGLETIIVHTPEWEFEKKKKNVLAAMEKHKTGFSSIFDPQRKIAKKFKINWWPTRILLDKGKILYKHVGEGGYKGLENYITFFLKVKSKNLFSKEPKYTKFKTLYCGKKKGGIVSGKQLRQYCSCLKGSWTQKEEYIRSGKNSVVTIVTKGTKTNFVASSLDQKPKKIAVTVKKKIAKILSIKQPGFYPIMKFPDSRKMELSLFVPKNTAIYSFSFE